MAKNIKNCTEICALWNFVKLKEIDFKNFLLVTPTARLSLLQSKITAKERNAYYFERKLVYMRRVIWSETDESSHFLFFLYAYILYGIQFLQHYFGGAGSLIKTSKHKIKVKKK